VKHPVLVVERLLAGPLYAFASLFSHLLNFRTVLFTQGEHFEGWCWTGRSWFFSDPLLFVFKLRAPFSSFRRWLSVSQLRTRRIAHRLTLRRALPPSGVRGRPDPYPLFRVRNGFPIAALKALVFFFRNPCSRLFLPSMFISFVTFFLPFVVVEDLNFPLVPTELFCYRSALLLCSLFCGPTFAV